ncbi:MAG: metallophosphoesterase [Acidobacteriia bacterium]|nr:metallophosphoesterase [Terriglobia bacterium]
MKILIFSDIHSDLKRLEELMAIEADYYFAAGDMVSWARGLDAAGQILSRRGEKVFVLPGNHESEGDIEGLCKRHKLNNFHGHSMKVAGYHIGGLGYSNPTPFDTPGEYSEAELATRLAVFAPLQPLILICHCPPKGTLLDRASPNRHFGSASIRQFLDTHQPPYFFCGHIHEAEGASDKIGATVGVNVGKKGYLLEFDKITSEPI